MIIIHAYLVVDPKHREEFLTLSKSIVEGSQAEEGNITYRLFEESDQPNSFVIVERWKDQAAVDFHNQTAHFLNFVGQVPALVLEPVNAEVYEVVDN
ncbi:hypothetical protein CIG75_06490 [Tumebacillus algifaecis]|uniref:ABM domain-containing protein n=1 Tax=Tumebacillus algifaecis TaxID=1214604 RepID=A0A223CZ90_9BACL|nr:putative quinol monooxygenase [Tumebacillus algifaecis]ASS74652.1 hypothetical protein CIG75_06490 [Tumebacillus algifaecis]